MERRMFLKAAEEFYPEVLRGMSAKGIEPDMAQDAFQNMMERNLISKAYTRIPENIIANKVKVYLMQATKWEMMKELNKQSLLRTRVGQLLDEDEEGETCATMLEQDLTVEDITECPFCHVGVLNQHGACGLCHTILGKGANPREERLTFETMVESECPDLGLFTDVNMALAKLDELERKVVLRIVHGNESLEDLVELTRIPRTQLWRIWTRAKAKLQQELFEYSHVNS